MQLLPPKGEFRATWPWLSVYTIYELLGGAGGEFVEITVTATSGIGAPFESMIFSLKVPLAPLSPSEGLE
jgi:hypothetical protein